VPERFLSLEDARQITFGERGLWQYTYTLTYRYIQAPVGKDRGVSKLILGKVSGYQNFIKAVARAARTLGASYVAPASTPEWGVLSDPSGQQFEAADILLRVVEFSAD
jgi:hypothetical protein